MNLLKPVAALAILSVLAAPSLARSGNPAERLSLDVQDSDTGGTTDSTDSGSSTSGTTIALIAAGGAAVVGAALLLGDDDSEPASD